MSYLAENKKKGGGLFDFQSAPKRGASVSAPMAEGLEFEAEPEPEPEPEPESAAETEFPRTEEFRPNDADPDESIEEVEATDLEKLCDEYEHPMSAATRLASHGAGAEPEGAEIVEAAKIVRGAVETVVEAIATATGEMLASHAREQAEAGFGALGIAEPARAAVDLAEVERRDRENTIRALEAKAARGTPLKAHEKKELRRLQAAADGRRLVGSLDELATALGVSLRTVKYWAAEEGFPIEGDELYDVETVAGWRAARGGGAPPREPEIDEGNEEQDWAALKDKFAALREKLKYETERGKLIPVAEVHREWAARATAISTGLLSLPRLIAPLLFDGQSNEAREAIIDKHVRALLTSYTRPLPGTMAKGDNDGGE